MGLLDIYNQRINQLNTLDPDLVTQYPATVTGTPTRNQNPGGPVQNFDQSYDSNDTYLDNLNGGELRRTLRITNLDVEDSRVQGGIPYSDYTTNYPSTVTGTPNDYTQPGIPGPLTYFEQTYLPSNTYVSNVVINRYSNLLDKVYSNFSALDVEDLDYQPYLPYNNTSYPATSTGTPTALYGPFSPAKQFRLFWSPSFKYLDGTGQPSTAHPDHPLLIDTLEITSLDIEDSGYFGGPNEDTTTVYPLTVTGTPTSNANPGGPRKNFDHPYTPTDTYLDNVNNGQLENTLNITNLDVENSGVQGGPNADTTTQYPSTVTGTPTSTQNPGGPVTNFNPIYSPSNTYLDTLATPDPGTLRNTLNITNLDIENPGVQGGPNADTKTQYPSTVTGTPNVAQNPGAAASRFVHPYDSVNTYLNDNNNGLRDQRLQNILPITNLDVENPGVQGGPNADTTTVYPASITGTPTATANPGGAVQNFDQPYTPSNTYLDVNYNISPNNTILASSLPITNLDVENPGVQGGPNPDITTVYPSTVTGTPTSTQNPGGPVTNFTQPFSPSLTYVDEVGEGKLKDTLPITNLDVENPSVLGGPNKDTTTQYSSTVTGTPTSTQNPGGPLTYFEQIYLPSNTYVDEVGEGKLKDTLNITNLDVEDSGVQGGPNEDIVTNFSPWVTGTPNQSQNPGAAPQRFVQKWTPNKQYIIDNTIAGIDSGILYNVDPDKNNSLKITNLDTTEEGVQGGIPYDQLLDPTVYPITTNHTSPIRGWFPQPSSASGKFNQVYNENNTYSSFISSYT